MHHLAFGHLIVSALVRGVIYGMIWKVIRHLTMPEAAALVVVILVLVVAFGAASRRLRG